MHKLGHLRFTFVMLVLILFILYELKLLFLWKYTFSVFITSLLPDFLEIALSPNHRQYFHSYRIMKHLFLIGIPISLALALWYKPDFYYLFFAIIGYFIHLLGDMTTQKGLPR